MLMDLEVRRTPLTDYLADPARMAAACDDSTILIVGSAPCFPYGLIDPIGALSALAQERGLWLHVDACVGGYQAPFVRMNGAALPAFDFALAGVRSMSADLHKYGFCAKGASTVLFRDADDLTLMRFEVSDWPAGKMATPTLAGTRPGGAIAAAWAVMNFLGVDGYRAKHRQVTETREKIEAGARALGFHIVGAPQLGIVAFSHDEVDGLAVLKRVYARGWVTSAITEPRGLHLMLSPEHARFADAYLDDLAAALNDVKAGASGAVQARYGA
jgi:glutamate/tyrosine decarboxylase-like PLP-dependent enzyme